MSRPDGLSQWSQSVSSHLPHLSRPQAKLLAAWSYGIVIAQSAGISSVAAVLANLLQQPEGTLRQRLREFCYAAADKRGAKRRAVDVRLCFAPLLRWVVTLWPPDERRLALALDATTLGQRFTVLSISVVYAGCAIPIAWRVLAATRPDAWRPHWEALLAPLRGSVPATWTVLVLADRGLYARWLYTAIVELGWHPFLRINLGGLVRPHGQAAFRPLRRLVPGLGSQWQGAVTCFASPKCQLSCTLLARWEAPHAEPWLVLTDLAPAAADVAWYGIRAWIECGFKDLKRGGWHWHQTKMVDPERATRLWLALAVATLWAVSVGAAATPPTTAATAPPTAAGTGAPRSNRPHHRLSCFRRGVLTILTALILGRRLPEAVLTPLPWPASSPLRL